MPPRNDTRTTTVADAAAYDEHYFAHDFGGYAWSGDQWIDIPSAEECEEPKFSGGGRVAPVRPASATAKSSRNSPAATRVPAQ
jgi:hypothetical protein